MHKNNILKKIHTNISCLVRATNRVQTALHVIVSL